MTKFVFTYHENTGMPEDPAEVEKLMGEWGAWFESMGEAVVDGGNPFGQSVSIGPDGSTSDGSGVQLGGYSIIEAADIDTAVGLAKKCPTLAGGGKVLVSEAMEM